MAEINYNSTAAGGYDQGFARVSMHFIPYLLRDLDSLLFLTSENPEFPTLVPLLVPKRLFGKGSEQIISPSN